MLKISHFVGLVVAGYSLPVFSYELPLALALKATQGAVQQCEQNGYHVTAAYIDRQGETRVLLKGDDSTIHTKDTAVKKAYTVVTLGPIFNFNTSSDAAKALNGKPAEASFLTIPNIALLPGAVAVKVNGKIVGALGVGGAPGGDRDEACAVQGVNLIAADLPQS